jgi:hypothetical protein
MRSKGAPESEGPRSRPSSGPTRGLTDGVLSELLKRLVEAGAKNLSAEPMRQLLAEMKLPKDALLHLLSQHLLIQLEETKENVYRLISRELKDLLERTNVAEEIASALTRLSLDVTMRVRFSPTEGEAPSIRLKVTPRDPTSREPSPREASREATSREAVSRERMSAREDDGSHDRGGGDDPRESDEHRVGKG